MYDAKYPPKGKTKGEGATLHEFGSYEEILMYWVSVVREFYKKRVEREILWINIYIEYIENIQRYLSEWGIGGKLKKIDINNMEEDAYSAALENNKFKKFAKSKVENPVRIKEEDLISQCCGDLAKYTYLINLTTRDEFKSATTSRNNKLTELHTRLAYLKDPKTNTPFTGAAIWLNELAVLEGIINEGIKTNWAFNEVISAEYR